MIATARATGLRENRVAAEPAPEVEPGSTFGVTAAVHVAALRRDDAVTVTPLPAASIGFARAF